MAERRRSGDMDLARLRKRIDAVDRKIVALLDERAGLALEVGRAKRTAGRRAIRDGEREREVLLRVSMAKTGPIPTADLLAIYRRIMATMRRLESADRRAAGTSGAGQAPDAPAASDPDGRVPEPTR